MQENQRPPVYNAEDYIISLKKYGRRTTITNGNSTINKSIYDTTCESTQTEKVPENRASTLPTKQSDYKYEGKHFIYHIYNDMFFAIFTGVQFHHRLKLNVK